MGDSFQLFINVCRSHGHCGPQQIPQWARGWTLFPCSCNPSADGAAEYQAAAAAVFTIVTTGNRIWVALPTPQWTQSWEGTCQSVAIKSRVPCCQDVGHATVSRPMYMGCSLVDLSFQASPLPP